MRKIEQKLRDLAYEDHVSREESERFIRSDETPMKKLITPVKLLYLSDDGVKLAWAIGFADSAIPMVRCLFVDGFDDLTMDISPKQLAAFGAMSGSAIVTFKRKLKARSEARSRVLRGQYLVSEQDRLLSIFADAKAAWEAVPKITMEELERRAYTLP